MTSSLSVLPAGGQRLRRRLQPSFPNTIFSAKTVIPFSTHGGSGLAGNARDTAKLTPQAKHLPGKAFYGSRATTAGNDVKNWLKELGF